MVFKMGRLQKYGIKFPFKNKSIFKTFVDLDVNPSDSIRSQIMHLLFTPVGQRLRKPLFGTKLIQFIFNPNDGQTWGDVVDEVKETIKNNIPNCTINDLNVSETENGLGISVQIDYSVVEDGQNNSYQIVANL